MKAKLKGAETGHSLLKRKSEALTKFVYIILKNHFSSAFVVLLKLTKALLRSHFSGAFEVSPTKTKTAALCTTSKVNHPNYVTVQTFPVAAYANVTTEPSTTQR